jgi:hypothetical protein
VPDSPFEATARRLGALVGALDPRAQALFFSCAAHALLGERADDVDDALAAAYEFAVIGRVPDEVQQMLAGLDALQASLDEVDLVGRDALICADIALRLTYGGFNAHDGVWYVLEPQFQATSQRLFGFTDVGSEREGRDEAIALRDATLARAVDAVEVALARLSANPTHQQAGAAPRASAQQSVMRPALS